MAAKILLYLSAEHATAAFWRDGLRRLVPLQNNEEGWNGLANLLAEYAGVPVYLVVDSVEEEYRSELLPHVHGRARHELVARKLRQSLRNAAFCASWEQGRDSGKRRDDKFLFVALTMHEILRPWLDTIQLCGNPLAGVYLLPMVTQTLLGRLHIKGRNVLLVSKGSGGLRQSFFQDGQLKISRLTPLELAHDTSSMTAYATEIGKTRLFLNSQRLVSRDDRIALVMLDCRNEFNELLHQLNAELGFTGHTLRLHDVAKQMGAEEAILRASPDAAHLYMLGLQPPPVSLAPPELRIGYRLYRARRMLYAGSMLVLALATGISVYQFYQRQATLDEIAVMQANIRRSEVQYEEIARRFPSAPASAEEMKQTVEMAQLLRHVQRTPESAMAIVSRALDASPDITLAGLHWNRAGAPAAGEQQAAAGSGSAMTTLKSLTDRMAGQTGAEGAVALVEGEVMPFHGDYRAAIAHIHAFAGRLKSDGAVAGVSILSLPLDIDPASSLKGSTLKGEDAARHGARFKLKLSLKGRA